MRKQWDCILEAKQWKTSFVTQVLTLKYITVIVQTAVGKNAQTALWNKPSLEKKNLKKFKAPLFLNKPQLLHDVSPVQSRLRQVTTGFLRTLSWWTSLAGLPLPLACRPDWYHRDLVFLQDNTYFFFRLDIRTGNPEHIQTCKNCVYVVQKLYVTDLTVIWNIWKRNLTTCERFTNRCLLLQKTTLCVHPLKVQLYGSYHMTPLPHCWCL